MVQTVPQKVNVTALPCCLRQHLGDRRPKSGMVVGDHQFHTRQAASPQAEQKLLPATDALAIGKVYSQNAPPPIPVDPDRHEHGALVDRSVLADTFVACIQDQVRVLRVQMPRGKQRQLLVDRFFEVAGRSSR